MDPLETERRFHALISSISFPASAGWHLNRIQEFVGRLDDDLSQYESYLVEIAERFPPVDSLAQLYGFDPQRLGEILGTWSNLVSTVPQVSILPNVQRRVGDFQVRVAAAYACVCELMTACRVLSNGEVGSPEWLAQLEKSGSFPPRILVRKAMDRAKELNNPILTQLKTLSVELDIPAEWNQVLVPVVERSFEDVNPPAAHGTLRKIMLKAYGLSESDRDDLQTNVSVTGADVDWSQILDAPASAARELISDNSIFLHREHISGIVTFDRSHSLHIGSSANLALAGLIYCVLLRLGGQRMEYTFMQGVAVTGAVESTGDVRQIDPELIPQKVQGAFFSAIETLVLPLQHLDAAIRCRRVLHERYPHRSLDIIGVNHLRELFFDRRITAASRISFARHSARKVWKMKWPAALALIVILVVLLFRAWYGPFDKNPVLYRSSGEMLELVNASGEHVYSVKVGEPTARYVNLFHPSGATYFLAALADFDGNGQNELVWVNHFDEHVPTAVVRCVDVQSDRILWSTPLRLKISFPHSTDVQNDRFQPAQIRAHDIDNDGRPELFLIANHEYFPSILVQLDPADGRVLGQYLHIGHLHHLGFFDFDADGVKELVVSGINNAFRVASLSILDSRNLSGHSPLTPPYRPEGYEKAQEIAYILFPRTVVGDHFAIRAEANAAVYFEIDETTRVIEVAITEVTIGSDDPSEQIFAQYSAWFDSDLRFLKYSSGSGFDHLYQILMQSGKIPPVERNEYWMHHAPRPLYWDGDEWQQTPPLDPPPEASKK